MLSQVLTRHCDIVSARGSARRNQLVESNSCSTRNPHTSPHVIVRSVHYAKQVRGRTLALRHVEEGGREWREWREGGRDTGELMAARHRETEQ